MKLYWRYKKDGKWTWKAAEVITAEERGDDQGWHLVEPLEILEEEE